MKTNARKPSTYDANRLITNDLLPKFLSVLENLEETPAVTHLRSEVLSKYVSAETDPPELRQRRAIDKWLSAEDRNRDTNLRLEHLPWEFHILPRVRLDSYVRFARALITKVIGVMPPDMDEFCSFSGGATTSRVRRRGYPADKYVGRADITVDCLPEFEMILDHNEFWKNSPNPLSINLVRGNVMFTVPKNSHIDRVACKEPDLNMFVQKGVGSFIGRRLRRFGINLNDQSVNRGLAQEGSRTNSLATLDLSSASDSVTTGLCELLLPTLWYSYLMRIRSPYTLVDGEWHVNEMMSSMGNGFTFELESLIFFVLSRTTAYFTGTPGVISVYGDDIIVPSPMANDLISVLQIFGFDTNNKKTFIDGPFRESCGGHYYNGVDITPFYIRKPIKRLTDIILLGNMIRRWSTRQTGTILDLVLEPEFSEFWRELSSFVPETFWGGRDVMSNEALVTPHLPRMRLCGITSPTSISHWGDYAFFLHVRGRSDGRLRATGRYRPSKNRVIPWSIPTFEWE